MHGLVAVALTSLVIYSLKWSVTPFFFSVDHFLYHFLTDCEKMNKQTVWEGKKAPVFLSTRHRILATVEMWPLNNKISSENVSSSPNFLLKSTWVIIGGQNFNSGIYLLNFGTNRHSIRVQKRSPISQILGDLSDIISPKRNRWPPNFFIFLT